MKVVAIIGRDHKYDESFGGMGGFFNRGMRWRDYLKVWTDKGKEYAEAAREYILANGIKYNASTAQDNDEMEFLFDDETVGSFTWRAWGDLIAAVWSEAESHDYCYMDFYC